MGVTSTAFSFSLLSVALGICAWRFFEAYKKGQAAPVSKIGSLLTCIFALSSAYNGILGLGSLFFIKSPSGLFIISVLAYLALSALTIVSIYTLYYIFWPQTSSRSAMTSVGILAFVGLVLYIISQPQPQLTQGMIDWNLTPSLLIITFSLLTLSLLATLYIALQLFKNASSAAIKTFSFTFALIAFGNVIYQLFRLVETSSHLGTFPTSVADAVVALIGAGLLIALIPTPAIRISTLIFLGFLGWWIVMFMSVDGDLSQLPMSAWPYLYNFMAVFGVWLGSKTSLRYGGFKTLLGRTVLFFTLGLFGQVLGQNIFNIYTGVLSIEVPYPSLADIPYFASPILYLIGLLSFGKVIGVNYAMTKIRNKGIILATFLGIITLSYFALGSDYSFDNIQPLIPVLDTLYPLAEGAALTVALLIFLSHKRLYKQNPFHNTLALASLAVGIQYLADTIFSYQAAHNSWILGSLGELPYLLAYFLMAAALIKFESAIDFNVKNQKSAALFPQARATGLNIIDRTLVTLTFIRDHRKGDTENSMIDIPFLSVFSNEISKN